MEKIRKDAGAIAIVGAIFVLVATIGFTPRYFGPLFAGRYVPPSDWMHLHVISSLSWLLVFFVQPLFIVSKRFAQHRLLGRIALVIAMITAGSGLAVQTDLLPVSIGDQANLGAFTARFVSGLAIFIPAVVFAVIYRRRTAWHLRLMYLATISLMPAPFGRIMIHYLGISPEIAGPLIAVINILLVAALPIYDRLAHGKVERISWIAFVSVFLAILLTAFFLANDWWAALMTRQ